MSDEEEYTNGHDEGSDFEPDNNKRKNESDDDFDPSPKKKKRNSVVVEKPKKSKKSKKDKKIKAEADSGYVEKKSKTNGKVSSKIKAEVKSPKKTPSKGVKVKKEKKEEPQRWKWWEQDEKALPDGHNWKYMEHNGPIFAPPYEPLPSHINLKYDGSPVDLSEEAEEVMTFYAKMLDHDYTTMEMFNKNFMEDWRSVMTHDEKVLIKKMSKCDFLDVANYFKEQSEIRKARSREEKKTETAVKLALVDEKGWCVWDGHKEKIGNLFIEPPGLFRGRGAHPKMGKLKKRVKADQVIINCSKDAPFPEPPAGFRWKEIRHDPTVSWLATWTENVQSQNKYVMLNANSKIKGCKDLAKYEKARMLHKIVDKVRANYQEDLKAKEMASRQRAVAMYFIDKLALRAGNEKDTDEAADTVGCCSLRVEHITLLTNAKDSNNKEKEFVIEFKFLGKDSMEYHNKVGVEKRVFKNVKLFMENKAGGDDLFDRVNTSTLNSHLTTIMDGLTAKVFRTYNASITLQRQLKKLSSEDASIPERVLQYNQANRKVAILCNHKKTLSKNHGDQMGKMDEKIQLKMDQVKEKRREMKSAKSDFKSSGDERSRSEYEKKKKQFTKLEEQLHKLEIAKQDKEENAEIALGTSKLNYLDPRISVAWARKFDVPIEKVYNKTQRDKFQWAIDMVDDMVESGESFVF